jgi:hypothetical protein
MPLRGGRNEGMKGSCSARMPVYPGMKQHRQQSLGVEVVEAKRRYVSDDARVMTRE